MGEGDERFNERDQGSSAAGPPIALWLVPVPDLGGVARHVLDVTRTGIPGWRVVVLCPEGALAERLRSQGSAVVAGRFGPGAGVRASRRSLALTARALRPDIVHSHLAYADIINAWTRLPRGARRFTTEHGIAGDDAVYHDSTTQARLMALVHRARFPRFDGVIAVANATRKAMIAKWHVRQSIEVIPNGVDLPPGVEPRMGRPDTLRILSLSRLSPEKRIDKLIDAFALVKMERPDATLTIAGEGPLRDELVAQAARLDLADSVSFPGFVDADVAMAEADLLVQLSVWENCSYTLLDARANGIAVVAADVGGNGEILDEASLVQEVSASVIVRRVLSVAPRPESCKGTTVRQMCTALSSIYGKGAASRQMADAPGDH
ncbi:glycosyltransferase family 4 protein [Humibacter ginsenosidimutans]|uniref:glycosyltransferase family 4 protein n=1 Tax=Humibacter ginsenosidimutans TaxID=2599293 RepID=UPI001FEEF99F|nr:glycosyltransferase family 4 protein [Humibacter ginsenosidimutans]